jgi:hypothetical protein
MFRTQPIGELVDLSYLIVHTYVRTYVPTYICISEHKVCIQQTVKILMICVFKVKASHSHKGPYDFDLLVPVQELNSQTMVRVFLS